MWSLCSLEVELTSDGRGQYFLETPKQEKEPVSLKQSMSVYAQLHEWEQDGEDYGDMYAGWLKDIAASLPVENARGLKCPVCSTGFIKLPRPLAKAVPKVKRGS